MKIRISLIISLSSACLVLVGAQLSGAQGPKAGSDSAVAGSQATAGLVPAEVELNKSLDARKDQAGATFEAALKSAVRLKDGTELPKGTLLEGKVTAADAKGKGGGATFTRFYRREAERRQSGTDRGHYCGTRRSSNRNRFHLCIRRSVSVERQHDAIRFDRRA